MYCPHKKEPERHRTYIHRIDKLQVRNIIGIKVMLRVDNCVLGCSTRDVVDATLETPGGHCRKHLPAIEEVEAPSQACDDSNSLACNKTENTHY